MKPRLLLLVLALWWGGCTAIGFLVVPMLFATLPSPALAGQTAAKLFTAEVYAALALGAVALALLRPSLDHDLDRDLEEPSERAERALRPAEQTTMILVVAALLAALLMEFAVAPRIVARENLRLWHSVGTGLYLLQWALAGLALWRGCCGAYRGGAGPSSDAP